MPCASRWCLSTQARWSPLAASTPGASTFMSPSLPQDWFASDIRLLSTPGLTILHLDAASDHLGGVRGDTGAGRTGGPDVGG